MIWKLYFTSVFINSNFHIFIFKCENSIININVFGSFILNLIVDMHGQNFEVYGFFANDTLNQNFRLCNYSHEF
jgi:hypothetical protein